MKEYIKKASNKVKAIKFDGTNGQEILDNFPNITYSISHVNGSKVYQKLTYNSEEVPIGYWMVLYNDGNIAIISSYMFNSLYLDSEATNTTISNKEDVQEFKIKSNAYEGSIFLTTNSPMDWTSYFKLKRDLMDFFKKHFNVTCITYNTNIKPSLIDKAKGLIKKLKLSAYTEHKGLKYNTCDLTETLSELVNHIEDNDRHAKLQRLINECPL